ncbi:MAG: prevent-host-death protein [Phascolarctobacterium sp.]|nr:MAG: prevent-host-death protein [Phascolarctobacterium sp.]
MSNVLTAEKIVPISNFNKDGAAKIFEDVKKNGTKYVFKNNLPECVLISPERYDKLLDRLFDMELYIEAMERINAPDRKVYSADEAMKILGVTDKDLEDVEVDIE